MDSAPPIRVRVVLIALGVLLAACSSPVEEGTADVSPKVLELSLGDRSAVSLPILLTGPSNGRSLLQIAQFIEQARENTSVRGILLRTDGANLSRAETEELVAELDRFRETGKRVVVFAEYLGNQDYLLASQMDRTVLVPTGSLDLIGLSAEVTFYRDLLDKIGVRGEFVRAGSYKSAVEPYTRSEMSPQFREMMNRLLDDLYSQMVDRIAQGRDMAPADVHKAIDGGPYTAQEAKRAGLVDDLLYEDQLEGYLDDLAKEDVEFVPDQRHDKGQEYSGVSGLLRLWMQATRSRARRESERDKIALIRVDGIIVPGTGVNPLRSGDFTTSGAIQDALRQAASDPTVKAIVIRVDSPGGSALAADLIWRALHQARDVKPVVVSMGSLAASGGYYVAMGADHILAEEGTITGSIGVFGGKFDLSGLYDKLGIRKQTIQRGQNAGLYRNTHGLTPSERERIEAQIQQIYTDFVSKAAEDRGLTYEAVDKVAQGQVWTGREALERGLVDEIGGLKRAFAVAKLKAGYPVDQKLELLELPETPSLLDALLSESWSLGPSANLATLARRWIPLFERFTRERAFVMLPFAIRIR